MGAMMGGGGFGDVLGMGGGGPLGMMGMDVGLHKIPLIGNFFQNPNEQHQQEQFHKAAEAYGAYRPEAAQARMNALRNAQSAFQGANDLLATFTGGKTRGIDATQMGRQPMGPTMMMQGQSASGQAAPQGGDMLGGFGGVLGMGGGIPGMPGGIPGMPGGIPGMGGGIPGMGGM